jgi:hypothetical protein
VIFKYGSYSHAVDECAVRISTQAIFDDLRRRMGTVYEYTILGVKRVPRGANDTATKAALTAALASMEQAYAVDYQDFGLYLADGTTPTRHVLSNAATFGGVKVLMPPRYDQGPWGQQVEYLDARTYAIVLRAEVRTGSGLHSWKHRVSIQGTGGPKWVYSPQESGEPQRQQLQSASTFLYLQEGEAVGRTAYPSIPSPLYPSIEHEEMRVITYDAPADLSPQGNEMYRVQWRYVMEATTAQGFSSFTIPPIV